MAFDEDLAERVRELLATEPDLSEKRMFGGLAFLLGGHMALAVSGQGGIMVRVGASGADELIAAGPALPVEMGERTMGGWVRVGAEHLTTKRRLARWVKLGVGQARSLAPKTAPSRRR